ncbi:MAG: hypothetical protein WCG10_01170 [Chlamydiota bacterium]
MKALYSSIVILVLVALACSIALIPTREDLAFIALKSQNILEAKSYYEGQYKKGNHSLDVILMLSILSEKEGNLEESIALMKEYIKDEPQDISALKRLADLYQTNQQYDKYFQTLLEFNSKSAKPDKDILVAIINEYPRAKQSRVSLLGILEKLVHSGHGGENDYLELAYIYAANKEYKKAATLLETRREFFPEKESINDILFEFWIDLEIGKTEGKEQEFANKGLNVLIAYLKRKNDPILNYYAFGILKNLASEDFSSDLASEFIAKMHPWINKNLSLEVEVLQYHFEHRGFNNSIVSRIHELQKVAAKSPRLQNFLFTILLDRADYVGLSILIHRDDVKNIEQSSIINFALVCIDKHMPRLSQEMEKALGEQYLQRYPVIAIALAIASEDKDYQQHLDNLVQKTCLTQTERYDLLRVTAAAQLEEEAMALGEKLPPYTAMKDFELMNTARAYTQIHQEKWLYEALEKARPTTSQKNVDIALNLLDISLGNSKKVAAWLKAQKKLNPYVLDALYSMAEEKKEYPLALYLAQRSWKDTPSSLTEANYALALAQVGKEEQALSMLKKLYENDIDNIALERIYLSALVIAAKRNRAQENLLRDFLETRQSQLPVEFEEDLAYAYLDVLQDYPKAEKILWKLAQGASPQNSVTQSLIYLWGPNPPPEKIQWIENKALEANPKELGFFLEDLNYVGKYEDVITIFQKRVDENLTPTAYFAYMDALNHQKQKVKLHEAIDLALAKMSSRKDLERLAVYATSSGYTTCVKEIWERIAKKWPHDPKAWQGLAKVAYEQGDYTFAKECIHRFFALCSPSIASVMLTVQYREAEAIWQCLQDSSCLQNKNLYETFYQYGMIFKKQFHAENARDFFQLSLRLIEKEKDPSFQMQEYKALVLYQLGKRNSGIKLLYSLYQLSSHDPSIGADYLNILMDQGQLRSVRQFLENVSSYGQVLRECSVTFERQE